MEKHLRIHSFGLRLCLTLALAIGGMSMGCADDASRQAMADAMSRMMEAMGFNGQGTGTPSPGWPNPAGSNGFTAPLADLPGQVMGNASVLEGLWEGNDGSLLIVQGPNYRIYAPGQGSIDGALQVASQRVQMTNPRMHYTQEFEYALDDGRLALRSADGRIFLYRRLVLRGGGN